MHWILDGYNIIHADHRLSKIAINNLEAGRDELIQEIASAARFNGESVFLVFDGRSGSSERRIAAGINVMFSNSPESADDVIKRIIGNYQKRRSIVTVTNDHSIVDYAKECGAKVIGSEDFLLLARARKSGRKEAESFSEKPPLPSKPDLELLKLFKEKDHEI
jgi:predicted RNA-binding protein with PIN domain